MTGEIGLTPPGMTVPVAELLPEIGKLGEFPSL
jgi:hypothetical protein